MTKIRFYYTGEQENLDSLQPAYDEPAEVLQTVHKQLQEADVNRKRFPHVARCMGINLYKQLGWIVKTEYDLTESNLSLDTDFLQYIPDTDDYEMIKYESKWRVNIPENHYLLSVPTLYDSVNWFSLPGAIHGRYGPQPLNSFIVKKKGVTIPKDTPIAQWILLENKKIEVIKEYPKKEDIVDLMYREKLTDYKLNGDPRTFNHMQPKLPWSDPLNEKHQAEE